MMQFFARPLKIALATRGTYLRWQERALLAWIGPRGIVAAAVAALFAIDPKGQLHTFTAETKLAPGQKWILLSLVEPEAEIAALSENEVL